MKKALFSIFLGISVIIAGCSGGGEEVQQTEELVKTVNVNTQLITPSNFESYLKLIGSVETSNDIMISAEVSGRVLEHLVSEGAAIKKGQPILKIDDSKLLSEEKRLTAATEQAKENYERLERIYTEDGIGSELNYLTAKYAFQQSQSALESIQVDLKNTEIVAPFNGIVETIMVEEGEMASPGTPVVRLIGSDEFIVSAGVPARYSDVVDTGDKVKLWFDTQAQDTLTGTISYVANAIDNQNRTFKIEVLLPNENNFYKVDMLANMQLQTLQEDSVLMVSEEYVYSANDDYVVYVLDKNEEGKDIAKQVKVTLGPDFKTNVIVRGGLEVGDKLITVGSAFLKNGTRLNVIESK